ncbi:MAG: hypothetical protein FJW30_02560 [Acidobacteria bacterium]|nr:hypothetical protein [Acidobacteriota bacterium]
MPTAWKLGAAFVLLATLLYPQPKKSKKEPKAPELTVEKIEIKRDGEVILLDGVVKNSSMRTMRGLTLHFEFFAPNRKSLTILNGPVESAVVEPEEEAEFRLQVRAPHAAVSLVIEARDKDSRDFIVANNGPHPIE